MGGGLLHEGDLGILGIIRVIGAIAPRVKHGLDAGVQRDKGVDLVLIHKLLERLDLRLGGGRCTGCRPVHVAYLLTVLRLDIVAVPLVVECAVHIDPACAGIVAKNTVLIPVGAFHTEHGQVSGGRVIGLSTIERGDEAVSVNVCIGIAVRDVVPVGVSGSQVGAVVDDKGLLIAVWVDDGDDIDDVVVQQSLYIVIPGAKRQPPCGIHRGGSAFTFAAVYVGKYADPVFFFGRDRFVGDLHAPEVALLPRGTDGIERGDIGIGFGHLGKLRLKLCECVAIIPVNVQALRDLAGCIGPGVQRQQLRLFAACRAAAAAGGKSQHKNEGKTEAQDLFCECFHSGSPFSEA